MRQEEDKREEARRFKLILEEQMTELKEREEEVIFASMHLPLSM